MTYDETAALMMDTEFRGRIKVSCLKYADSIIREATTVIAHNTRLRWAQGCFQNPDMTAAQVQPPTCMDAAIQADGKDTTDELLQGAVETTINKML